MILAMRQRIRISKTSQQDVTRVRTQIVVPHEIRRESAPHIVCIWFSSPGVVGDSDLMYDKGLKPRD